MASEKVHTFAQNSRWCSVPTFGPQTVSSYFEPLTLLKVESVQVVAIMTVVTSEDVHLIVIDNSTVGVSRARTCFWIADFLKWPAARVNTILMKVIYSVESIVAAKNVNCPLIDNGCVSVSCWGWWIFNRQYFRPWVSLKVKLEKVISTIRAIISSKDIEVTVKSHWRMQRPRTWWVIFVILLMFDQMPRSRFF
jgi:hypothetical protein